MGRFPQAGALTRLNPSLRRLAPVALCALVALYAGGCRIPFLVSTPTTGCLPSLRPLATGSWWRVQRGRCFFAE